jgi:hypothetical protein
MQSRTTVKLTAVTALSAVSILGGGLAAASTGALPGAAQQTARDALARVGVSVPGPSDRAAEASATRGRSAEAKATATPTPTTTESAAAVAEEAEESKGKGEAVSELATSTELTGVEKGAAISGLASGGKSQAGQHGKPAPTPTTTTTAAEPTDSTHEDAGARTDGRAKADEASGGRSGDRSGTSETTAP